jgi:hypothetical protein
VIADLDNKFVAVICKVWVESTEALRVAVILELVLTLHMFSGMKRYITA